MPLDSEKKSQELDDPAGWVDRYGDGLLRFALTRVGCRDTAEDLVQEAFLAAWQSRSTFDGRASLGTWLIGILRRKIADHYRAAGTGTTVRRMGGERREQHRCLTSVASGVSRLHVGKSRRNN